MNTSWQTRLKKKLLKRRSKVEAEIIEFGGQLSLIQKISLARVGGSWVTEEEKAMSLLNIKFTELKKVNIRLEEIKKGVFTGICPNCKKKREDKDIYRFPLRDLCISCQREKNNNKK